MPVLIVLTLLAVASIVYVYRFRGEARYASLGEYFRKGWPIFTPLNCALYATTKSRGAHPVLDPAEFPELDLLKQNWQVIRDEGMALVKQNYFDSTKRPGTGGYYDVGFRTFFKYGWSRFYVNWYGYTHHSARRLCPRTVELLKQVPDINGAMFAYLPAGGKLTRHADPVAVSLRYHLGLATPNDDACYINVDGKKLSWRDGQVIMFDETYLHFVNNDTNADRLILMCDVKRPLNIFGVMFNFFYQGMTRGTVVPNTLEDNRGLANRIFAGVAPILARSKALKATNRPMYMVLKWSVNVSLLALLMGIFGGAILLIHQAVT